MTAVSSTRLVGRAAERTEIRTRLALAEQGVGGLMHLRGEAGIGKTAIAEETAIDARSRGFDTAWSGCWQTAAVPPLHPWTRLIEQLSRPDIEVPELETGLTDLDAARLEQAGRVELWLRHRAEGPILIVLDDLHWADAATLAVLEHLAPILPGLPVLIIGAHRPPTGDTTAAFAAFDTHLRRHGTVVELSALSVSDTAELMSTVGGDPIDPARARVLAEMTGGNPLFIRELGRLLPPETPARGDIDLGSLRLPRSLRSAVTDRVSATSARCRELLEVLSVAGDETLIDLAAEACDLETDSLLVLLNEALDAGLVKVRAGVVSFRHALLRSAVYDSLSSATRARCHDRFGQVLLGRRERGQPIDAAALAHHFGRAAPLGNAPRVFEFAVEAAAEAVRMLSFDLATRRYEQALAMLALDPGLGERGRLLLELADAQLASGEVDRARETFRRVAADAARTGDAHTMGRAALGFSGGVGGIEVRLGDPEATTLLEEAARVLAEDDVLGPRVLARLSIAQSYRAPVADRAALASQARVQAAAGGDPTAVGEVLAAWCDVMAGPEHVSERLDAATEIVDRAVTAGDLRGEALGRRLLVEALFELGRLRAADRHVNEFDRVARKLGSAEYMWYPALWRGSLAFARAQIEVQLAARHQLESLVGPSSGTNADLLAKVQLLSISFDLADPEPGQPLLDEILGAGQMIDDTQTLVTGTLVRSLGGELDAAAAVVEQCIELALAAELDSEWPATMMQLTDLVGTVGGSPRSADLRAAIAPFGSVWAVEGIGAGIRGPLDRPLGILAALEGELDAADAHFTAAHDAAMRAGADVVAALADHDAGRYLGDHERLARAERLWRRIGATHRLAEVDAQRALHGQGRQRSAVPEPARANQFVCDGDVWSITFKGVACTLGDRKGLHDLARLLEEPGREIPALDLAAPGGSVVAADTGDAIDAQARSAYRARLVEIETELDEADQRGDSERSTRLAGERDALVGQLTGAYGLGGRSRRSGGSAERARTAVRSRVKGALDRITDVHPGLGRHLERSVRTGIFCVYDPDPLVEWVVKGGSHSV